MGIQAILGQESGNQINANSFSDSDLEIIYSASEIQKARALLTQETAVVSEDGSTSLRANTLMGDHTNSAALNMIS